MHTTFMQQGVGVTYLLLYCRGADTRVIEEFATTGALYRDRQHPFSFFYSWLVSLVCFLTHSDKKGKSWEMWNTYSTS
jgi:hypothetical protein